MPNLFPAHAIEDRRGCGKVLPESLGVVGVGALILFFQGNSERENFALQKRVEVSHSGKPRFLPTTYDQCKSIATPFLSSEAVYDGSAATVTDFQPEVSTD